MYGLGAEVMGPPQDPNQLASETAPDVQQQIADLWSYVFTNAPATPSTEGQPVPVPTTWLPGISNTAVVLAGAAVFVIAFLSPGGRRR